MLFAAILSLLSAGASARPIPVQPKISAPAVRLAAPAAARGFARPAALSRIRPVAAPRPAAIAAPSARVKMSAAQVMLARPGISLPAADDARRWDRYWSASGEASGPLTAAPAASSRSSALARPTAQPARRAPTPDILEPIKAVGMGLGLVAGTHLLNRILDPIVKKVAGWFGAGPDGKDKAAFIASLVVWGAVLGGGMYLLGVPNAVLLGALGMGVTLLQTETIKNGFHITMLLLNKPFVVGEKIRIDNTLYEAMDFAPRSVELRVIGDVSKDEPTELLAGSRVVPLKELDPLGREVDDKGNRFVIVSDNPDADPNDPDKRWIEDIKYSKLQDLPVTVFRAQAQALEIPRLVPPLGLIKGIGASFVEAPWKWLAKAVGFSAAALGAIPLVAKLKASATAPLLVGLIPFIQAFALMLGAHALQAWVSRFVTFLVQKLGGSRHLASVMRLGAQVLIYITAATMALTLIGFESVALGVGATFAAGTAFAVLSRDILTKIFDAIQFRFNSRYKIGQTVKIGTHKGVVEEMNRNYLILKVAESVFTLLPYSLADRVRR